MKVTDKQLQEMITEETIGLLSEVRYKTSEVPDLRTSEVPDTRTSEVPDLRTSEVPDLRTSEVPDLRTSEVPDERTSAVPDLRTSELPDLRTSEVPDTRTSEVPDTRTSEVPDLRTSEVPDTRTSEVPDTRTTPTVSVKGLPSGWRRFAGQSAQHTAMAKKWIEATSGGALTEAALPSDSSFAAFQGWYNATKKEIGGHFGPSKAIELIGKASKRPKMASPEVAKKARAAMAGATVTDKIGGERFNLQAELTKLQSDLAGLKREKPVVAKNFEAGKRAAVQARGDAEAYSKMGELTARIKQIGQGLEALEESIINESTYSRWQKLIKN